MCFLHCGYVNCFFFQAEDGIRARNVTGVQTCALPIFEEWVNYFNYDYPRPTDDEALAVSGSLFDCPWNSDSKLMTIGVPAEEIQFGNKQNNKIGRASCRETETDEGVGGKREREENNTG